VQHGIRAIFDAGAVADFDLHGLGLGCHGLGSLCGVCVVAVDVSGVT